MKIAIYFILGLLCYSLNAQKSGIKVDINMEGRTVTEVNEPGYTSWYITRVHTTSITASGINFTLTATGPTNTSTFRCGWSKLLVQSPNYSRLVNDGVKIDNDTMLAHPGQGAKIELRITGLTAGKHTLQTYHNIWEDTTTVNYCPMNVYVNGVLTHDSIKRSIKIISPTNATILLTELNVLTEGQEMVVTFEPEMNFVPVTGKKADYNMYLNAFELDTDDASKQAREPMPAAGNMHVDADTGSILLKWKPAINGYTKSHSLFIGTDSLAVVNATNSDINLFKGSLEYNIQEYKVDNLYNLNTYYWRVDQTDSSGLVTKGKVWSFRPRHLAFNSAEGYGRFATGGRGGKVVYVTNLNDAGPGSFREATTSGTGPRTVIFNVSGIITLNSKIFCDNNITIAGQTAPGKGICLRKSSLAISSESVCRFIRMRLGFGTSTDGMGMPGASESIIDHCSVSWSIDEGCTSRNALNVTFQKVLISEALNAANLHGDSAYRHSFAAVIGGDIGTFHHNLLAHNSGRNPRLDGGVDGLNYYKGRVDIFNNVIYNWNAHSAYGEAHEANFVNNYYKQGPATNKTIIFTADVNQRETNLGTESYYTNGNVLQLKNNSFFCNGSVSDCGIVPNIHGTMTINWDIFVKKPFFESYAKIETAYEAYKSVLSDVGCTMPVIDDHDKRMIEETMAGTYKYSGSITGIPGIIDSETDAGGYENYPEVSRPADFDFDNDGLPNWWENLHGSNPNSSSGDFSDSNADPDKDGYTALDNYLEWMSVPHYYLKEGISDTIDLSIFTVGFTNNPQYSTVNSKNIIVTYEGKSAIITPNTNSGGINYINFKVTDAEGDTLVRIIGICVGASDPTHSEIIVTDKPVAKINIYPTLFETSVNIDIETNKNKQITSELIDSRGKMIQRKIYDVHSGLNAIRFDCPSVLSHQLYFLKITEMESGKILTVKKLTKK